MGVEGENQDARSGCVVQIRPGHLGPTRTLLMRKARRPGVYIGTTPNQPANRPGVFRAKRRTVKGNTCLQNGAGKLQACGCGVADEPEGLESIAKPAGGFAPAGCAYEFVCRSSTTGGTFHPPIT